MKLRGIEAALRRLPDTHPNFSYLQLQQRIIKSGMNGENHLNSLLNRINFKFDYFIFHDLHLKSTDYFQMDSLILTPYYAIILEMKNISGNITIRNNHPQLERVLPSGQSDYFKNPIGQVIEMADLFNDFLEMRNIQLPIYSAVVFKDANRSLKFEETTIPILGLQELPHFIRTRPRMKKVLNPLTLVNLIETLLEKHLDYNPFPLTKNYSINPEDIITGVICSQCQNVRMERILRGWTCRNCGINSKTAHIDALADYSMLISHKINNKECCRFLHTECKVATEILRNSKMKKSGSKKRMEYFFDYKKF